MDRVAMVGWGWFLAWIGLGYATGYLLFGTPKTGALTGLSFALLTTIAWPWLLPERINAWMDEAV